MNGRQRPVAESLALSVLSDCGVLRDLSTHLNPAYPCAVLSRVADHFSVTAEVVRGLATDGVCTVSSGQRSIRLSNVQSGTRTVFTFAHELAHVAMDHYAAEFPELADLTGAALERFCDNVAGRIVLPTAWLTGSTDGRPTLAEVMSIARKAHLSPTAVTVRLREVGHRCGLLQLRRLGGGSWIVAAAVGLPHEIRRIMRPSRCFVLSLERASRESLSHLTLELVHNESVARMDVSCSGAIGGATVLVERISAQSRWLDGRLSWTIRTQSGQVAESIELPSRQPWEAQPLQLRLANSV
jgi:IrrE N-terminal-like domain